MLNYTQTEQTTKLHKRQHHKGPQPSMNDDDQFKRQLSMKNDRKKRFALSDILAYSIYSTSRNIYASKIVPSKSCLQTPETREFYSPISRNSVDSSSRSLGTRKSLIAPGARAGSME
jgi:hypothetical protein